MDIKAIGQFIKTMRKKEQITQKELAEQLNISPQALKMGKWRSITRYDVTVRFI